MRKCALSYYMTITFSIASGITDLFYTKIAHGAHKKSTKERSKDTVLQNKSSINQSLYTEAIYINITTHLAARCEQNTRQNVIIVSLSNQYSSNTCLKLQDTMKTIKVVRSYTIIAAMCQHLIQRISILTKKQSGNLE